MKRADLLENSIYREYQDREIKGVDEIFVPYKGWVKVAWVWSREVAAAVNRGWCWSADHSSEVHFAGVNLVLEWADGSPCYNRPDFMFKELDRFANA